jgi:hypothetical protein
VVRLVEVSLPHLLRVSKVNQALQVPMAKMDLMA